MDCASCGKTNRPGARFCSGCGGSLASRCPECGAEVGGDAQFCDACGRAIGPAAAAPAETRKVVTIVFADLAGSTSLHEQLDAESVRRLMERYYGALQAVVETHGGTVVKLMGDGVMAAFGIPNVREDDALRAVRAAVEMQSSFAELAGEMAGRVGALALRIGVNSGEVVVRDDDRDIVGDPVNVAARLQQEAGDGNVLIGDSTRRLVGTHVTLRPVGALALKGRAETVRAYRVESLERPDAVRATTFVGREEELQRVMARYDAAVEHQHAEMAVLLGSPGLGKSRLLDEVARRLGDSATVLAVRCEAGGATFAPVAEALRVLTDLDALVPTTLPERTRILDGIAALLAGAPPLPEETFFVVRRMLAALAAERPVVLALDDMHWAEPLLLDLAEHLVEWSTDVPLLVLVAARPELRDLRSVLATPGRLVHDVLALDGLDASAAARLAAEVVGTDELPAGLAGHVLATSEGNPLFLGELVRMLVDDGSVRREGDRWVAAVDLTAVELPPTISALLAARIERLPAEDRTILERAAVIGRYFSRAALADLVPPDLRGARLDTRLEALRRSELIEPDATWFLGDPVLRFHHVLIREAAYQRLLKETRAELHVRFADWLAERGDAAEHDETLGLHLEAAHEYRRDLGVLDEETRRLGARAGEHLMTAGRRALARDDVAAAANLLGRALGRLDDDEAARAEIALDWCEALLAAGDVDGAARAVDELARWKDTSPRIRAWHACFTGHLTILRDPRALRATVDAVATAAVDLAAAGDDAGEARASFVHALALASLGQVGAAEAALDRALVAARRVGDWRRANAVLSGAPLAALWGPGPVTRASGRCLDVVRVLRITSGSPAVEAVALRCQAVLEALRGRTDAARKMIASSRHAVEELGLAHRVLQADMYAGIVEMLDGDLDAAVRELRNAYDGLRDRGLAADAAQTAALLARAVLGQGDVAEAEALSHECERLAGDDFKAAIAWRGVRAEALARRGEHADALELARAAVELASATDMLLDHADARVALATALRAAGRPADADAEMARAIELWEAKGATALVERARGAGSREPSIAPPALARFEELAAPQTSAVRRLRPNAATEHTLRLEAAFEAGDFDVLHGLLADEFVGRNDELGVGYDKATQLALFRSMLGAPRGAMASEPIATLGDSLALLRGTWSFEELSRGDLDWGPSASDGYLLVEVDSEARRTRLERFATRHLGSALTRLYERYAEALPESPERERAEAVARSMSARLGVIDLERYEMAFEPAAMLVDHRSLGFGTVRGAQGLLEGFRTMFEMTDAYTVRIDDVLGCCDDTVLVLRVSSGIDRGGGGPFERRMLELCRFGADGLVAHLENFEIGHEHEALDRFEELTSPPAPARRRVHTNAATENVAQVDVAFDDGDFETLRDLHSDGFVGTHDETGLVYDTAAQLSFFRTMHRAPQGGLSAEPIATLGDSLALLRATWSLEQFSEADLDLGPTASDSFLLVEVDAEGRRTRLERFAIRHLGLAVARLYERYAELAPEGPERIRAEAVAGTLAATASGPAPDRFERVSATYAADVRFVDHRVLGFGSERGSAAAIRRLRPVFEGTDGLDVAIVDVLAAEPGAVLLRRYVSGTDRADGVSFEREFLQILRFGASGLVADEELFDVDRVADALARFDKLTAPRFAARPVRPNAATENVRLIQAARAARDLDAIFELQAEQVVSVHHPTGITYDRKGVMASTRSMHRARSQLVEDPLATLGDSLALCRITWSVSDMREPWLAEWGPSEFAGYLLVEVDASGLRTRYEHFADDRLGDACARLYERYAELLPEGPERATATARARAIAAALHGFSDSERMSTALAADVSFTDHRSLGLGTVRGADRVRRGLQAGVELSTEIAAQIDEVLAAGPNVLLIRCTVSGTDLASGGRYEREALSFFAFAADGLADQFELFDTDRVDDALARFDELAPELDVRHTLPIVGPNAATAANDRWQQCVAARDWSALRALCAPGMTFDERRRGTDLKGDVEMMVANAQMMAEAGTAVSYSLIATYGDRLAIVRMQWATGGPGDRIEGDALLLTEVDSEGRFVAVITFEPDDRRSAFGEALTRFGAGEAAAHAEGLNVIASLLAALARRDWEAAEATLDPRFARHDHRRLAIVGRRQDAHAWIDSLRVLADLSHDVTIEAVRACWWDDHGAVLIVRVHGTTADGGAFENVFGSSYKVADGRVAMIEVFDVDDLDRALARFAELDRRDPLRIPPNLAVRTIDRWQAALEARDFAAVRDLCTPGYVFEDRRHDSHTTGGVDMFIANVEIAVQWGSTPTRTLLATYGDRLALERMLWTTGEPGGVAETETLWVVEVDDDGLYLAAIGFDADDRRAAVIELQERWARGGGAQGHPEFQRAFNQHDLARLRDVMHEDLVWHDHKRTGVGMLEGPDAYLASAAALFERSADITLTTLYTVAANERGSVGVSCMFGTVDGGEFESPYARVNIWEGGRLLRCDVFEPEDLDLAVARFEELCHDDATLIPPNAATRAIDASLAGEVEMVVANAPMTIEAGAVVSYPVVATLGDRIAIARMVWHTGGSADRVEGDALVLVEVDREDRFVAAVAFDPEDEDAAFAEALDRFLDGEGAAYAGGVSPAVAHGMALINHDWEAARRSLDDDFEFWDRRDVGVIGTLGPDAWIESSRVLEDLAVDSRRRVLRLLTWDHHGVVSVGNLAGTLLDGGRFESVFVNVFHTAGGRVTRCEAFDLDDVDRALARFDELSRSDPPLIPPNAATRGQDRWIRALDAQDWDEMRATLAPGFVLDDRRTMMHLVADRDRAIASTKLLAGMQVSRTTLATFGDRLAVERIVWQAADATYDAEMLNVLEVGADGEFLTAAVFDIDERRAAFSDALNRFVAGEAASCAGGVAPPILVFGRALDDRDWEGARRAISDDFVFVDERGIGVLGELARDQWIDMIRGDDELVAERHRELFRMLEWDHHGIVAMGRFFGALRDGGQFENLFITLFCASDGLVTRNELYDLDDVDRARARFEELRPPEGHP